MSVADVLKISSIDNGPARIVNHASAGNPSAVNRPAGLIKPDMSIEWKAGDKAVHGKFGTGTVVAVTGGGDMTELKIAFPNQGIKKFMQKYAPIRKA